MDVRCPQCDTLYEVDAQRLRGSTATLKCSTCDHVFHMHAQAAWIQENQRRWMVKSIQMGDIRYFSAFDELHQWILKGTVTREDEISRTGQRWKRLADIGEFMPIFQAAESIRKLTSARTDAYPSLPEFAPPPFSSGAPQPQSPQPRPQSPQPRPQSPQPQPQSPQPPAPQPAPPRPLTSSTAAMTPVAPTPRPRAQTSQQFGSQHLSPLPPSPRSASLPPAARPPQAAPAPTPGAPTAPPPAVRLQSGAFGAPSSNQAPPTAKPASPRPPADDEWSFGDLPLGVAEGRDLQGPGAGSSGSGRWRQHSDVLHTPTPAHDATDSYIGEVPEKRTHRARNLAIFLVFAAVAGVAGVYFLQPSLLAELMGEPQLIATLNEPQAIGGAGESGGSGGAAGSGATDISAGVVASNTVFKAVGSSQNAARRAQVDLGVQAGQQVVLRGVQKATTATANAVAAKSDPATLLADGQRALQAGNPARARAKFHQVLEHDRANVEAITGLGWSLLATGQAAAATAQFRKAISFNPGYGDAYIGLGKAERDVGNTDAALDAYQRYLDRFPGGPKASIARYQSDNIKRQLGR